MIYFSWVGDSEWGSEWEGRVAVRSKLTEEQVVPERELRLVHLWRCTDEPSVASLRLLSTRQEHRLPILDKELQKSRACEFLP